MQRNALRVLALMLCLGVARVSCAAESLSMNQMIADLGLPEEAAERILRGEMVQIEPGESSDRELAVGLAFLVLQPPVEVLKAFRSEVDLRSDPKVAASVAIVGPGTPEDFASLVLQPNGSAEATTSQRVPERHSTCPWKRSGRLVRSLRSAATPRRRLRVSSSSCCSGAIRPISRKGFSGYLRMRAATDPSTSPRSSGGHRRKCESCRKSRQSFSSY